MLQALMNALFRGIFLILHVSGIGEFPKPLSANEEQQYLARLRADPADNAAKNKLVEHNLRLVAHIAKKYTAAGCEQEDLISIGTIGLIKAVTSFNNLKGARLVTYASRCIENEILMYFRSQKKCAQDIYMSDPIDMDSQGNALTLCDIIASDEDIAESVDLHLKSIKLRECITRVLNERERRIIEYRYGLGGRPTLTQREVARRLKISRSYVSRIESRALMLLRMEFEEK